MAKFGMWTEAVGFLLVGVDAGLAIIVLSAGVVICGASLVKYALFDT